MERCCKSSAVALLFLAWTGGGADAFSHPQVLGGASHHPRASLMCPHSTTMRSPERNFRGNAGASASTVRPRGGRRRMNESCSGPLSLRDAGAPDDAERTSSRQVAGTTTRSSAKTNQSGVAINGAPASQSFFDGADLQSTKHDHITILDKLVISLATAAVCLSFAGIVKASGPGGWRYYLAGGICASSSHAVTTPIDVVKTRQQVDPHLKQKGMIKSLLSIVKTDGIQSLLAGLGPTTFGYLIEGAVKFGLYEVLKPAVRRLLVWLAAATSVPYLDSKVLGFVLCGTASGTVASAVLCPMEAIRIRQVAEPDFAPKGWIEGGYRMLKYEGVGGLWKGMSAMLCKQVPYTVMKNVSFDFITTLAYQVVREGGHALTARTKIAIPLLSAMAASVLSCISSQPGDMLLSLVNAHKGERRSRDITKEIIKKDGVKGFFVGMKARFLHVGIIVTVQLLLYDFVKRLCGIAATGSTG